MPAPQTFATKGDATRWLVVVEADIARGRHVDLSAGRVTLRQWADQWLARPGKRANSVARDRQALAVFMADLGDRPLASITAAHVQAAVDARGRPSPRRRSPVTSPRCGLRSTPPSTLT